MAVGESQLDYILGEYLEHYNTERPHQARGNVPLVESSLFSIVFETAQRGKVEIHAQNHRGIKTFLTSDASRTA